MTAAVQEEIGLPARRRRELRLGPVALTLPAFLALVVFFLAPLVTFFVYSFLTTGLFSVSVADLPGSDKMTTAQINTALDQARDGLIKSNGGVMKLNNRISISAGKQRYSGREFTASTAQPGGQMWAKIFLVGKRQYTVMVVGTNQFVTSKEADTFIESFRLLD